MQCQAMTAMTDNHIQTSQHADLRNKQPDIYH